MSETDPSSSLTLDELCLLKALVDAWPKGRTDVALDANALWVGEHVGLTKPQATTAVDTLASKGLVHMRRLEGVLMVHPTPKALALAGTHSGLVQRIRRLLRGNRRQESKR